MGFDNECILDMQSLPGEYFCPVCRTLVYPNEALQSQCTHLYCKPCLAYVVATTRACPYDGYLVTDADSKPLMESNKAIAETIGKVAVYCLYHRSGCQWQGTLSECLTHCTGCSFGDSAVLCNRCGTQIVHRQVQEHAQICPGLQPQAQQLDTGLTQVSAPPTQVVGQETSTAASAAPATTTTTATVAVANTGVAATTSTPTAGAPASAPATAPTNSAAAVVAGPAASTQIQAQVNAAAYAQSVAQVPTPEQWYQQQQLYHQYYQQYPGYDQYQQQYQQYAQYQQQAYTQYAQSQMQAVQQQPLPYMQSQSQVQPLPQPLTQMQPHQLQPQPQPHPQQQAQSLVQQRPQAQAVQLQAPPQHLPHTQPQAHLQPQPQPQPQLQHQPTTQAVQMQVARPHAPVQQPYPPQPRPQTLPLPSAQVAGQQLGQSLPHPHHPQTHIHPQTQAQQQLQAVPHQQPLQLQHPQPQMQNQQPLLQQPPPSQTQPQAHSTPPPQHQLQQPHMQLQPHPQPQSQPQPQPTPQSHLQHPSAHAVTGHQSFPQPQMIQQAQPGVPPQRPMPMQPSQQGMPYQHPVLTQSQLPPQQPPQLRPAQGQLPLQVQQQPIVPPHGMHSLHPPQQHPHHFAHHSQQLHQHSGLQPPQAQQQSLPHQAQVYSLPSQPHLQGGLPPQQQLHPQGSMPVQQHVHPHLYPQHNVAQGQALPTHQSQAIASRPIMVSLGMPQQAFQQSVGIPHNPVQPSGNQQNQNHLSRPATGSQGSLGPTSTASGVEDKGGHAPKLEEELLLKDAERSEKGSLENAKTEKSASAELKNEKVKSEINEEYLDADSKEGEPDLNASQNNVKDLESHLEHENVEGLDSKLDGKQEVSDLPDDKREPSLFPKIMLGDGEIQDVEGEPSKKSVEQGEGESGLEHIAGNTQVQQMPAHGGDSGHLRQPIHQNTASSYERALVQPRYHERNPSQSHQGPVSDVPPGMPPAGLLSGQERYPPQQIPPGHPSNFPGAPQRFPPPDRMFPQPMAHSGPVQDRKFHEPSPYPMQARGHSTGPGQMRPLVHGLPEPRPNQGPPPSVVPEQPHMHRPDLSYGSYHLEGPHAVFPSPGLPTSSARVPGNVGLPHKSLDLSQSHMPLQHAVAPRTFHGESLTRPSIGGPPSGAFDASPALMPRGPFGSHDHAGPPRTGNAQEAETYGIGRHGMFDGKQADPHLAQSSRMSANGFPGKSQLWGMHDPAFAHGLASERFKPLNEERFNHFPEDVLPGRASGGRREFEEDLKQFPKPPHLDGEGISKFDGYFPSSRPGDRGMQQFGEALPRPFDRGFSGVDGVPPFSSRAASSECHMMDISKRSRPVGFSDEFGINHDQIRPMPEFGPHCMDTQPPFRSPGRFGLGGKLRFDDFDGREMHGFMERSKPPHLPSDSTGSHQMMDQLDSVNLPGNIRKDLDARDVSHIHFRHGEPLGHGFASKIRGSETFGARNVPSLFSGGPSLAHGYSLPDFANEPGHVGSVSVRGDMDTFEHSRKRKRNSIWCLICKIDCETLEGLEMHSQTRQHQKTAMDVVMSIKLENSKMQRISVDNVSLEESNKPRKMIFENRGNRK